MPDPAYTKLPGSGLRRDGGVVASHYERSTLWLGADHLLVVDEAWTEQRIRRFSLKDIQALSLCRTNGYLIWNCVNAGLCAALLAGVLGVEDPVGRGFFGFLLGLIGLIALIHLARGPTSVGHLQTAIQTIELPSLGRVRRARKVLARLVPLVEAAQGALTGEEAQARVIAQLQQGITTRAAGATAARRPVVAINSYAGGWHRWLYLALILDGGLTLGTLVSNTVGWISLSMVVTLLVTFLNVVALVKQNGSRVVSRLRVLTWWAMGYGALGLVVGSVMGFAFGMANPGSAHSQLDFIEYLAAKDPFEQIWYGVMLCVSGTIALVLGLLGSIWVRQRLLDPAPIEAAPPPVIRPPSLPLPTAADPALNPAGFAPPKLPAASTPPAPPSVESGPANEPPRDA